MKARKLTLWLALALAVSMGGAEQAVAQAAVSSSRPFAENVIMPQARHSAVYYVPHPIPHPHPMPPVPRPHRMPVQITGVDATVTIVQQVATTTLNISLNNPSNRRQEAEVIRPAPAGAVIRSFGFEGAGPELTAKILPKDEARRIYDEIVRKMRDPALLEFIGYNLVRSSVFPVDPGKTQKVQLVYENLLAADGDRVDYELPRTESLDYNLPWTISVNIKSKRPISTVYSPSHEIDITRKSPTEMSLKLASGAKNQPGPFRLSYLLEGNGVTASLLAYPDPKMGGGYFLLLAGLPAQSLDVRRKAAIKREVTLVLDRSGSMNGEKLDQVREAALQVLAGLEEGEAFNLIVYNTGVDMFSERPALKSKETIQAARGYLNTLKAAGGTNIHDALIEALRQKPTEDMLPIVLFLTDGLPTVGNTSEKAIRDVAAKGNPYERRIFTFGVGMDVNTPLLDKVAEASRATSTFVLPKEDVEVKVASVFKKLSGPVLADPKLTVSLQDSREMPNPVRDLMPAVLPDLFEGDQLIVLGQYLHDKPMIFEISGNYLGEKRRFIFTFDYDGATTRNAFVPRLWASRKIAVLIDAVRQLGADGQTPPPNDPRMKELVDEIVRLSTEFGILTEYTAFLAREGTDLAARDEIHRFAESALQDRAMSVRSGVGSMNQSYNYGKMRGQKALNRANAFLDAEMNEVSIATVQQINDRAFYKRGNRWVDSRMVTKDGQKAPDRVVVVGSDEFWTLVKKLADENRQGCMALKGEILLDFDGEAVLVK